MVPRPDTARHRRLLYEEGVAIIADEYASDIQLGDVARRIFTSPRQLQRAFEEVGGRSFRDHLIAVRMDRAAELIRNDPAATIWSVSRSVGYRQQAHFAKAFRRYWDVTPGHYRHVFAAVGKPVPPRRRQPA